MAETPNGRHADPAIESDLSDHERERTDAAVVAVMEGVVPPRLRYDPDVAKAVRAAYHRGVGRGHPLEGRESDECPDDCGCGGTKGGGCFYGDEPAEGCF